MMQATYSPEDNKLRLYASSRLDAETYARVKAVGFIWAPKQDLFVAPTWTPARADLLIDLCGEIEDEDKSLVERSEERADRFVDYSDKRQADANAAHKSVSAITSGIPLGQPILVGHHSERHARNDAARIESGMRKAVQCWETAGYWKQRAAGALHHAKYKELPAVRARRIKGIGADKRKQERYMVDAEKFLKAWSTEGLTLAMAKAIANYCHISRCFPLNEYPREAPASQYEGLMGIWSALEGGVINEQQARDIAIPAYTRQLEHGRRWIGHYENRLAYEMAMLDEQGATSLLDPKPRRDLLPLCNYRAPAGINIPSRYHRGQIDHYPQVDMTKAEYSAINKDYKAAHVLDGTHRVRTAMVKHSLVSVFLTDSKVHTIPAAPVNTVAPIQIETEPEAVPACGYQVTPTHCSRPNVEGKQEADCVACDTGTAQNLAAKKDDGAAFKAMREQLKQGVQVVSTPQLFPTPPELARRMVELAEIEPGQAVLEPSAGTGRILRAIREVTYERFASMPIRTAVEINSMLCDRLRISEAGATIHTRDFLQCHGDIGTFHKILMNPPFGGGQDIEHIKHAIGMLKPGGRLVAICADGPRQNDTLKPIVDAMGGTWEKLPQGTFKESGTNVNTVLLTMQAREQTE